MTLQELPDGWIHACSVCGRREESHTSIQNHRKIHTKKEDGYPETEGEVLIVQKGKTFKEMVEEDTEIVSAEEYHYGNLGLKPVGGQ